MKGSGKVRLSLMVLLNLCLVLSGCAGFGPRVQRFGQLAQIKPGKVETYKDLHAKIWPEVVEELKKYNVHNYSIYMKQLEPDQQPYLFGYFEYTGKDFDGDMAKMMENPTVQKWEDTAGEQCLVDMSPDSKGLWWVDMEEVFYFDGKTDAKIDETKVQRYGMVIGLRPEMVPSYKLLHKYAWPEVLDAIEKGNIRNYSIYLHKLKGKYYLFSYFEYIGDNFNTDMSMVDNDPATIAWIKFTDIACQIPIPTRAEGEWWAVMEEVYHCD